MKAEKRQPIAYIWRVVDVIDSAGEVHRGHAMVPKRRYYGVAKKQFRDGMEYVLAPIAQRNMALHDRYFATLHEYYINLPEKVSARWSNEEHFRKWILVATGWYNEKEFDFEGDEKAARRLARFIQVHDYAKFHVRGSLVIGRFPKSQALDAMEPEDFEASQKDVLEMAAEFVSVRRLRMLQEASRHA